MPQKTPRGATLRFFDEMIASEWPDECIMWPFARNEHGYAVFSKQRGKVNSCIVARVACAEVNGMPPTPKHEAAHLCGNGSKGCVNPAHLSWKTSSENKADQVLHGTSNHGERNGQSKLTADQARRIRQLAASKSHRVVASEFGVSTSTVSLIASGQLWGHV